MADSSVFIIMVLVICVESTVLSGKGLFCRDPDTGMLHPLNTTWSSSSFCGNYTCKLRRLNTTVTPLTPIREFNVTSAILKIKSENKTDTTTETPLNVDTTLEPDIKPKINENNESKTETNTNDDRYLTANEIKSISEMLHTIKKSDINAIVDIYNIAQEIYDEIDKSTDKSVDETNNNVNEKFKDATGDLPIKSSSYWYDHKTKGELQPQPTNIVPTTTLKSKKDIPTFFNGPLTKQDFGKIPYYYPISSFQRMDTYVHQPVAQPTKIAKVEILPRPPCQREKTARINAEVKVEKAAAAEKATKTLEKPPYQREKIVQNTQSIGLIGINPKDVQKLIKPSYLLPYPFTYVHNYNITRYPNLYYSNPWVWDYYYRNRHSNPYFKAYIAHIPNAVLINPHLDQVHDVEQKPVLKKEKMFEKENIPAWKTEPISTNVLNEVKANVDTSQFIKAFPLRKKVKVEKVGKVIKMDELTRHKRESEIAREIEIPETGKPETRIPETGVPETGVPETGIPETDLPVAGLPEGEFEPYIEKVTCEQRMEPGYFRYGNLTQPFPHCCPQLIMNSKTDE